MPQRSEKSESRLVEAERLAGEGRIHAKELTEAKAKNRELEVGRSV